MDRVHARRTCRDSAFAGGEAARRTGISFVSRPQIFQAITSNYAQDSGLGSHTFDQSETWCSSLLGTAAAGALLFFSYGLPAYAQVVPPAAPCDDVVGTTVTCTGDVSAGISTGAPYTTLNVNTLTTDIAPASGVDGINFTSAGDVSINSNTTPFSILATGAGARGIFATSSGGNVTIVSTGDISSSTDRGIRAQSTNGTVNVTSSGDINAGLDGISINGQFGATIDHTGDVTSTTSRGLRAFSGSGTAQITSVGVVNSSIAGIFATGFNGATIDHTGDVTSTIADAIRAVSNGGTANITSKGNLSAGDNGIDAFGQNGVVIHHTGDVTSTTSNGIRAESSVAGDIAITLDGGTVTGVEFVAGASNTLNNFGTVVDIGGGSDAISGSGGDETVNNYGTIIGNVNLDGGTNAFNNKAGATFRPDSAVFVGVGETLTNAGNLSPGGTGTVQTTALTGNLVQTGTGTIETDLDLAGGAADRINPSGTTALAGTVALNVLTLPGALSQQFTILSATGGTTDNGLGLNASPALNASLLFPNATDVVLEVTVDFSASGLNPNQIAIADHLDAALAAGGGDLDSVLLGLLNTSGPDAYKAALNQLIPELYSDAQITALYSSLGFANNLLSCRVNGADTVSIIKEGQCLWLGAGARYVEKSATSSQIGYTERAGQFAGGVQFALNPVWRVGFGLGYQQSWLDTSTDASSDGETIQGGVALKYNPGPVLLAATFSGGHGWYDTTRPVAFTGFSGTASASPDIDVVNGGLRAAYVFGSPKLHAKPMFDATATWLRLDGYTETGGGAANLSVEGSTETIYTLAPSLEVGTEWWSADGTLIRPFLRGGASWHQGNNIALSASFTGTPAGVSRFTIHTDTDDVMGTVSAGLDVVRDDDTALRALYEGRFGETTQSHSMTLKFSRAI